MTNYRKVILDASALIALINKEEGWDTVKAQIPKAIMSSVNVSEVAKYLIHHKSILKDDVKKIIGSLISEVISFENEQIYLNAELIVCTKQYGLSFGDRACIALGQVTGYPIYTTDKIWSKLNIENVNIKLIR